MTTIKTLAPRLLIITAALFVGTTQSPNTSASVDPVAFLSCPDKAAVANSGWSSPFRSDVVLEKSSVSNKTMYCEYSGGILISRPCEPGRACIAKNKGFDLGSSGTVDND